MEHKIPSIFNHFNKGKVYYLIPKTYVAIVQLSAIDAEKQKKIIREEDLFTDDSNIWMCL